MSSWRDSITINSCIWFENEENKKNATSSIISGLFFFVGWWLLIDAKAVSESFSFGYFVCGILGTISLLMVNVISRSQIQEESSGGYLGVNGARAWLFVGFVLGFASVIAAFWLFFSDFYKTGEPKDKFAGVELLLQNILIFLSSLTYKFGRVEDQYW